jgi:hypothetical protein
MDIIFNHYEKKDNESNSQCFYDDIERLGILFSEEIGLSTNLPEQCNTVLTKSINVLYQKLMQYQKFHDTVKTAVTNTLHGSRQWTYKPLADTSLLQVGITSFYQSKPVNLHDHPGSYGAQRVISGNVEIQQYQFTSESSKKQSIISLEKKTKYNLHKNECAVFQPFIGNLHEVKSITKQSVVLTMRINSNTPHEKSWYFPMDLPVNSNERLYNRVQKNSTKLKFKC